MPRGFVLFPLFRLASAEYQAKYIDNATIEAYADPDEMINDIFVPLDLILTRYRDNFTDKELNSVLEYQQRLKQICNEVDYDIELYNLPEIWQEIMNLSLNLIHSLGYSLDNFDPEKDDWSKEFLS